MNYLKMGAVMMTLFLASNCSNAQTLSATKKVNTLKLERNPYGFIFTTIEVNGHPAKAMIDFGDPNLLQLSGSFAKEHEIQLEATNAVAMHVDGSTFSINEGTVSQVKIGTWLDEQVVFKSSPGEIESVSQQIGTPFEAVIGWGYFSQYYTLMNYADNVFQVSKDKPKMKKSLYSKGYNKDSNYLSMELQLENNAANFILDTGSPYSLIDSSYVVLNELETLDIKLGENQLPLNLHTQDLSLLQQINAVGIIGGDFLQEYRILMDPFGKELIFYSNK